LKLGFASVRELTERLSSREIAEWIAYYQIEPFGEERADLRAAIIACVIANANRDSKEHPQPFSPADFMVVPFAKKEMDEDDIKNIFKGLCE
jgi:hypothetical protein